MKKTILVTGLALLITAAPAMAQMMGGGRMMEQQQIQEAAGTGGQTHHQYMNPCLMGGYGMGPGMMGGCGMGPGMMGGYGMGPGMMGGYGMGPGMMGGYGMGPGMMGFYPPELYEKQYKEHQTFLDETKDLRKKLHALRFDYAEALRDPATKKEDLEKLNDEMESIWKQIYDKKKPAAK